jgi:hypothetical protein
MLTTQRIKLPVTQSHHGRKDRDKSKSRSRSRSRD